MSPLLILALGVLMVGTAFLSGVFGMAGGMVLVGVLLAIMPLPAAMALHAVTQIASNLWRTILWRKHVCWRATWPFMSGAMLAMAVWSITQYVPGKPVALLMLGVTPFLARALPTGMRPDPTSLKQGVVYGSASMSLMLLTGISGPLVDTFFLGGTMDRRQIVATKSCCQVLGHAAKLLYFGGVIGGGDVDPWMAITAVFCSMLGTTLARRLLEALTDVQYRRWANRIITTVATYYVLQGAALLVL